MRHRLFFCALWVALASLTSFAAEDWPQFRGPTGQGLSAATGVPLEWSETKNVAWKVEIPGRGWSSPVLSQGKLYLTTSVGAAKGPISLHAMCFDAADGKVVWDTEIFQPDEASARAMHQKNSLASPTPIVTADRLYVHFGHLGTAALDLSGKILWRENSLKYPPVHGNGGSPVLWKDELIFTCDGSKSPFVAALDAKTGEVKWKTMRNNQVRKHFSFCTPLEIEVNGVAQIIAPGSGFVGAYEPETGRELWKVNYDEGYSVVPRPVFAGGMLFISSGFDNPVVYAINPTGAQGDATDSHVAWTRRKGGPNTPSMLAVGEELYFVSDMGIATCVDAKTGTVYWTHRIEGSFSASPVYAEGRIYFQSEAGLGIVVKADKTFHELSENALGERSLASFAMADGAIYIRTDHHLWKIAASGGTPRG